MVDLQQCPLQEVRFGIVVCLTSGWFVLSAVGFFGSSRAGSLYEQKICGRRLYTRHKKNRMVVSRHVRRRLNAAALFCVDKVAASVEQRTTHFPRSARPCITSIVEAFDITYDVSMFIDGMEIRVRDETVEVIFRGL